MSIRCAPRDTPNAGTVNAGGMPLTTIPVVGEAIPGSYRTAGPTGGKTCDWTRTDTDANIVERGTTLDSTTVTIEPTDGGFTTTNCAPWNPVNLGTADSDAPKIPGYNFTGAVGVDLQPGSYLSNGSSDGKKSWPLVPSGRFRGYLQLGNDNHRSGHGHKSNPPTGDFNL
ncbi:hypothetical protein BFN03_00005 [Rhodococcus sp. WMMA185]|uniref:hypothetical protein n=1 Tax=Rhodococcus sp. WMMA185 TaxID=679318 RepID=UPI0008780BFD|nr:hypothetical protein [Rhodococcus sp. WMMA185]AOW91593.1 hypothetical protein BFN03_00005 [Rhodococcus sp. WMMA185]